MQRMTSKIVCGRVVVLGLALLVGAAIGVSGQQAPAPPPEPAPAQQTPPPNQETPVFRGGVDLVAVDVSVVDPAGRPVRGLEPEDFTLEVDGEPRRIVSADFVSQSAASGVAPSEQYGTNEGAAGGRLIMIVVDQGNIRQGSGQSLVKAAERLLRDLGPGDRVGLAAIPGGRFVNFTSHVELVRQSLGQLAGAAPSFGRSHVVNRVGIAEALAADRGESWVLNEITGRECSATLNADERAQCSANLQNELAELAAHVRQQTDNSLTALRQLMTRLGSNPRPKTFILISEGLIVDRGLDQIAWVSSLAARTQTSLYAIHIDDTFADISTSVARASSTRHEDRRLRIDGLHTLVGLARGAVYSTVAGGDSAFARLSLELTGYYLVGFEPVPAERDGKPHTIGVRVARRGVEVRSRREFTLDASANAERTDEARLAETLRDPLLATEIRMRTATYSFPDPESANVRVLVTTGLGRSTDELPVRSVALMLTNEKGQLVVSRVDRAGPRTDGDHRYQTTVSVPPGQYTLKVAAVDEADHEGSVEHRFKAALTSAGSLMVGDLMLADADAAASGGLLPAIEPTLRSTDMSVYTELMSKEHDPLSRSGASLEIATDANGPALAKTDLAMAETKYADRRVAEGTLSMAELPPGDYVARGIILVGGRPVARLLRPFAYDPSSEARARLLTAALPEGGRIAVPAFDRAEVLRPEIVRFFLQQTETAATSAPPAVQQSLSVARDGDLADLPAALGSTGPDDPLAPFLRGLGLYARGELEPAAAEFRTSLRASSEFMPATFYLGACYAAGGRDKEAVGAWQTTLASETEVPFVYALTTDAYLRLRDWSAAIDTAHEASGQWPDDDRIRLRLARAHALGGQTRAALDALDPYLARHRDDHETHFLALRLLYEANARGEPVEGIEADRQRFERYMRAYAATDGPYQALIGEWAKSLKADRR